MDIFVGEKRVSKYSDCFLGWGRYRVFIFFSFFFFYYDGFREKGSWFGVVLFYFIAVLVSLVTMVFPSISFVSGFEPHSRVGFRFFSSADIFYDSVVWLGYFSAS